MALKFCWDVNPMLMNASTQRAPAQHRQRAISLLAVVGCLESWAYVGRSIPMEILMAATTAMHCFMYTTAAQELAELDPSDSKGSTKFVPIATASSCECGKCC
jgi:hypothetical protein